MERRYPRLLEVEGEPPVMFLEDAGDGEARNQLEMQIELRLPPYYVQCAYSCVGIYDTLSSFSCWRRRNAYVITYVRAL